MKILVAADLHIDQGRHSKRDPDTGLPTAWLSTKRCWQAACTAAVEHEVDHVVIAGDVFRHGAPSPEAAEIVADGLRVLSAVGIPCLIVPGNHEDIGRPMGYRHALERMADIPGVTVESRAGIHDLGDGFLAAVLPWPSVRWLPSRDGSNHAQVLDAVADSTRRVLDAFSSRMEGTAGVLFGHLAVAESVVGGRRGSEVQMASLANEPLVSLDDLEADRPWSAAVLGHIHRRQKLGQMTHYVGSIDAHDFGDEGSTKAVSLLSVDERGDVETQTIDTPYRQMRTVTVGPGDSPSDAFASEGDTVRLRVSDAVQLNDARKALEAAGAWISEARVERRHALQRSANADVQAEDDPSLWLERWIEREHIPPRLTDRIRTEAASRIEDALR